MAFRGGYLFTHFEGEAEPDLRETSIPETVEVKLDAFGALSCRPLTSEGSTVRAGEPLAAIGTLGTVLPAPVGGTVEKAGTDIFVIRADGDRSYAPVHGHPRIPRHMERSQIVEYFRASGCALLFDGRFAVSDDFDTVRHVVVNAVKNGPLDRSWHPGVFGDSSLVSDGVESLAALFPSADITIASNRRNHPRFESFNLSGAALRILSDKYPQEYPELLAREIHGVEPGTADPSTLVICYEDMIRTAECLTRGIPLIDRVMLVAGPGVSKPGWFRIRIGTPFSHIRTHLMKAEMYGPWRIVRGGVLSGKAVSAPDDEAITPSDREISVIREHAERDLYRFVNPGFDYDSYSRVTMSTWLPIFKRRLDSNVHGGVRPCVQCNFCDEVCPVGIYPHLIKKQVDAGLVEESLRLRPDRCIGCGLCDYVCPSKIDVSRGVIAAREEKRKRGES